MGNQGARSLRWRVGIVVLAAIMVITWVRISGRGGYIIQIDYTWTGEFLDGAVVMINGDSVGVLHQHTPGTSNEDSHVTFSPSSTVIVAHGIEGLEYTFLP